MGQVLNELRNKAQQKFQELISEVESAGVKEGSYEMDLTLPPTADEQGAMHPITTTRNRIVSIFEKIGFNSHTRARDRRGCSQPPGHIANTIIIIKLQVDEK